MPPQIKKKEAAEAIENNIRRKMVEKVAVNPKYYEKMSTILDELIQKRKQGVISYKELLEEQIKLAKNVEHPEQTMILNNLSTSESSLRIMNKAFFILFSFIGSPRNPLILLLRTAYIHKKNIKNMHLQVKPPDGHVVISAPSSIDDKVIEIYARTNLFFYRITTESTHFTAKNSIMKFDC